MDKEEVRGHRTKPTCREGMLEMTVESRIQEIDRLVDQHNQFRDNCLNLIASENVPSPFVERLLSAELDRRYGYYNGIDVNDRHYWGNRHIAQVEDYAHQLSRELFRVKHVDLRPLSGNIAGIAAMFALARAGDTVMEVYNAHQYANKMRKAPLSVNLNSIEIPWDGPNYNVDLDRTLALIEQHRPHIVSVGSGVFLFPAPVQALKQTMRRCNSESILIYDAAHVLGLIAGGRFQDPLAEGADVIISSTHKTFAGPQGGIIMTNDTGYAELIGEALSPLLVANHHLSRLPALAATFLEWLHCGPAHADAIVANSKAFGRALHERGVPMLADHLDFTETHMVVPIVDEFGDMREVADRLEECHIIGGAYEPPPEVGSQGLRLGVQELTRLGMQEADAADIADCVVDVLKGNDLAAARERAIQLAAHFNNISFALET